MPPGCMVVGAPCRAAGAQTDRDVHLHPHCRARTLLSPFAIRFASTLGCTPATDRWSTATNATAGAHPWRGRATAVSSSERAHMVTSRGRRRTRQQTEPMHHEESGASASLPNHPSSYEPTTVEVLLGAGIDGR